MLCRRRDGLHLGVGSNIVEHFRKVVPTGYDLVATNYDGTHRNFIGVKSATGFLKRLSHVAFIGSHGHAFKPFMVSATRPRS
jgi:hypothetical protein